MTCIPAKSAELLSSVTGLTSTQCDTVLQLISLPENGTVEWWKQYGYIEALHDGRGYTCTIFGACSGTGDLCEIVRAVQKLDPAHPLVKYLPALEKCRGEDLTGIHDLAKLIPKLADDQTWRQAVWIVYVDMYWKFMMDFCAKTGGAGSRRGAVLTTPAAKGFVLDTAINSGGDMPSFQPILKKMKKPDELDEIKWLDDFANARRDLLRSGFEDLDTSKTGDRCLLWRDIFDAGNAALARPLKYRKGYWNSGGVIA